MNILTPEPEKVPNLMMYYINNYNHDEQDIFTKIARYHIEFERIHPFENGSGRTKNKVQDPTFKLFQHMSRLYKAINEI